MPPDVTWRWADTSALAVSTGEFCSCSLPFQLCSHSSGPSGRIHAGLPCRVSVSALPQAGSSVQFALLKHDPLFLLNSGRYPRNLVPFSSCLKLGFLLQRIFLPYQRFPLPPGFLLLKQ